MDIAELSIADLVPHTGKMVLLDRILRAEAYSLSATLKVRDDGLLFGKQLAVPAWCGIEYMAQAIAVYAGIKAKQAGEPIRLGFLLGARRYVSNVDKIAVGAQLSVTVNEILQDNQLWVFDCRIQGENIDISASLNVYQPPYNHHE